MKKFYKHPLRAEWGFTYADLEQCQAEFDEFMFSEIGLKKLKVSIAKDHLVALTDAEIAALDDKAKRKVQSYSPAPIFAAKGSTPAKPAKTYEPEEDDVEFETVGASEGDDWMDDDDDMDD